MTRHVGYWIIACQHCVLSTFRIVERVDMGPNPIRVLSRCTGSSKVSMSNVGIDLVSISGKGRRKVTEDVVPDLRTEIEPRPHPIISGQKRGFVIQRGWRVTAPPLLQAGGGCAFEAADLSRGFQDALASKILRAPIERREWAARL